MQKKRPDFFVIGAPKCASSSIYEYLLQHPAIYMPKKSPNFFCDDNNRRNISSKLEYLALFHQAPAASKTGEVSEAYFTSSGSAAKMRQFSPEARIVCCLRNPVDRAVSGYLNALKSGRTDLPVERAFTIEAPWVELGEYYKHLSHFFNAFPDDQIGIFLFEDLKSDPKAFCNNIFQFLGVPHYNGIETEVIHNQAMVPKHKSINKLLRAPLRWKARKYAPNRLKTFFRSIQKLNTRESPDIPEIIKLSLAEHYRGSNLKLEALIGKSLDQWEPK